MTDHEFTQAYSNDIDDGPGVPLLGSCRDCEAGVVDHPPTVAVAYCPECHETTVDEDGCCVSCGASATVYVAESAINPGPPAMWPDGLPREGGEYWLTLAEETAWLRRQREKPIAVPRGLVGRIREALETTNGAEYRLNKYANHAALLAEIAALGPMPGCRSTSCLYAKKTGGQGTNGPCRCDECPTCGATLRNGRTHREWCERKEWKPEHQRELEAAT